MVYCKGGLYGSPSMCRLIPLSARVQPLLEGDCVLYQPFGMTPRTMQNLVKRVATGPTSVGR
jgi:hypothetical protein